LRCFKKWGSSEEARKEAFAILYLAVHACSIPLVSYLIAAGFQSDLNGSVKPVSGDGLQAPVDGGNSFFLQNTPAELASSMLVSAQVRVRMN